MNDFISRQTLLDRFRESCNGECGCCEYNGSDSDTGENCRLIVETPAANVQPVKRGKWIATGRKNVYGGKEIECSECHFRVMVSPEHFENLSEYEAFCCHCGVKMEETNNERKIFR